MTDLRKAAEMAATDLEELIHWHGMRDSDDKLMPAQNQTPEIKSAMESFEALSQALAQPETTVENNSQNWKGMDGAVAWHLIDRHADNWADVGKMMDEWLKANQALAQPEQEPFIYVREDNEKPFGGYEHCSEADAGAFPVYTTPPKREWVGLTKEDMPDED